MKNYRHIFGPVPSRRFGCSLGIDLLSPKTCSMDCVFCQLGRTTHKTMCREKFVPIQAVLGELDDWMTSGGTADFMTLAGSGEPTLHLQFSDVLDFVRRNSDVRSVLLTNGTTLHIPDVRDGAAGADIVKVSLSAWDQASLEMINRPHVDVRFDVMIDSIRSFRKVLKGELWLEVVIAKGMNDTNENARRIASLAELIAPDRVHLNTAVRPPAERSVAAVSRERLDELAVFFGRRASVIADFTGIGIIGREVDPETILAMLSRHPCTAQQIADVFSMHLDEVSMYLGRLTEQGAVRRTVNGLNVYYSVED